MWKRRGWLVVTLAVVVPRCPSSAGQASAEQRSSGCRLHVAVTVREERFSLSRVQAEGRGQRLWSRGVASRGVPYERMRTPKCFLSCSRNMKVSTVCGTKRIPAGTRPL